MDCAAGLLTRLVPPKVSSHGASTKVSRPTAWPAPMSPFKTDNPAFQFSAPIVGSSLQAHQSRPSKQRAGQQRSSGNQEHSPIVASNVRYGSFATDPFSASSSQCPLSAESDQIADMPRRTRSANKRHRARSAYRISTNKKPQDIAWGFVWMKSQMLTSQMTTT